MIAPTALGLRALRARRGHWRAPRAPRPVGRVVQGRARGPFAHRDLGARRWPDRSVGGHRAPRTSRPAPARSEKVATSHCPWNTTRGRGRLAPSSGRQPGCRKLASDRDNQVVGLILAPRRGRLLRHQTEDRALTVARLGRAPVSLRARLSAVEAALPFGPLPCEPRTSPRGSCRLSGVLTDVSGRGAGQTTSVVGQEPHPRPSMRARRSAPVGRPLLEVVAEVHRPQLRPRMR